MLRIISRRVIFQIEKFPQKYRSRTKSTSTIEEILASLHDFKPDLRCQSKESASCDGVRTSALNKDGLVSTECGHSETVYECFQKGVSIAGDDDCLGWRPSPGAPYSWLTFNEVNARSKAFGDGLIKLGVVPGNKTLVGTQSQNNKEYFITDMGCLSHSICLVPFYNQLEVKNLKFIINHAGIQTMLVDSNEKVKNLLKYKKDLPGLERIIVHEDVKAKKRTQAESMGIKMHSMREVEELGLKNPLPSKPPKPDDLYIVCYTSGTTGVPKGVQLTHRHIIHCSVGATKHLVAYGMPPPSKDDVMISYLPMAHIYERFMQTAIYRFGGKIGYFQGDSKLILDDIASLKPTIFPSVPRLLNRIHDKVMLQASANPVKKYLFNLALHFKRKEIDETGNNSNNTIWDKLIFHKIQQKMGGRVRLVTSGSAPLSPTVFKDLRCIFGCLVVIGYGATENAGTASVSIPGDKNAATVGPPLPCAYIKLIDVPAMNYFSKNNQGEVCIKGPTIFPGYLDNEEKTKESLTKDNWLLTGDIGQWTPEGSLEIIDRRKFLFKLSQGKFIAPEKVENILLLSPYLMQAYVYGDGFRNYIVSIAVVDPDTLPSLAKQLGITGSCQELCKHPKIKEKLMEELEEVSKHNGLSSIETVKNIYLTTEEFSVSNALLTPTFKLKRFFIRQRYADIIEEMYNLNVEKKC